MNKIKKWLLRNQRIRKINETIARKKSTSWIKDQLRENNYGMLLCWFLGSFIIFFLIELMQRENAKETWEFICSNSTIYKINIGIILIITSLSYLFRKKYFVYSIITIILLLMGFAR